MSVFPGQLITLSDAEAVARAAATHLAATLAAAQRADRRASLALSGGTTPADTYTRLARQAGLDLERVAIFWVDERAVPPTSDRSNYRLAEKTLLSDHPSRAHVHRMLADASDLQAAARDYERVLRDGVQTDADGVVAFDLIVLGVGEDGHTASLFPGEPTVDARDRWVAAVPAKGAREARLTLTAPVLEHARHVVVLAVGAAKRAALQRVWSPDGDVNATPARVLRACRGTVTWFVDQSAAGSGTNA